MTARCTKWEIRYGSWSLAATLKRIAKNGPDEFYKGETAQMLARDMAGLGGLITLDDLAHYNPRFAKFS